MAEKPHWGEALQGLGAWWSGRGPAYEEVKRREAEDEQARRRQAMIDDTMVMASLVEAGDMGGLMNVLMDRHDAVIGLGGNAAHTERTIQRLMSSNPAEVEAAKMDILRARNVLAPQQPAKWSNIQVTGNGQAVGINSANPSAGFQPVPMPEGVSLEKSGSAPNIGFGPGIRLKDEAGNLFFSSEARNPADGSTDATMTPVGHSNAPVGQLQIVNDFGQTPGQSVTHAGNKAFSAKDAANRADLANQLYTRLEEVRMEMPVLEDVIAAIDEGANSGKLVNMFPSLKSASIRLENLGKRMGLGVLSEANLKPVSNDEMKLALSIGMPPLPPDELKLFVQAKLKAQAEMYNYLGDAAVHFERGGTREDWLKKQEARIAEQGKLPLPAYDSKGWRLERDKNGNAAYVHPTDRSKYREVKD